MKKALLYPPVRAVVLVPWAGPFSFGFHSVLEHSPVVESACSEYAESTVEQGSSVAEATLASVPIVVVYSNL